MTIVLLGKGLVLRSWPSKIEVIGALGLWYFLDQIRSDWSPWKKTIEIFVFFPQLKKENNGWTKTTNKKNTHTHKPTKGKPPAEGGFPKKIVGSCDASTKSKALKPTTWRIIPGLGYVVNNHGDRFRPLSIRLWDSFQMAELHGL